MTLPFHALWMLCAFGAAVQEYAALWASLPVLAFLVAWKYKRRRVR